ncbi:hypothetical protein EJB05_43156, partial [Eragrostis curvula]
MRLLRGGDESNAPSSMKNKVLRPLLCLVMVFLGHDCGLVRVSFLVISIWMSLGFVFSHDVYGGGGDDELGYGLDGGKFIVFACGISVYPSFAKGLGFSFPPSEMRMTVVDGEMAISEFSSVAYPFGMMILDGEIFGFFKYSVGSLTANQRVVVEPDQRTSTGFHW